MAALLNAVKLTGRRLEDLNVLIIGLGAAGIAVDEDPARGRRAPDHRRRLARRAARPARGLPGRLDERRSSAGSPRSTNPDCRAGAPADVIDGADLLIGVSGARALPAEALARMNTDAMVFAMANPNPEVNPEEAAPYVRIMATGRSDYPNQINNVLCFPGIFRGALDVRAPAITEEMKMAAARAIAAIVDESELREDYIIPSVFNRDVAPAVAAAVAEQARAAGTALAGQEVGFAQGDTMTGSSSGDAGRVDGRTWTAERVSEADAMSALRVTVTGATGLIGPALVAALRERGAQVTVLSRDPGRARGPTRSGARRGGALGSAERAGAGRRRWPGATRSCTSRASPSPSAGARGPSRRSATAA